MKIRVLSDLHLEFTDWTPPAVDADIVVLPGDIHAGVKDIAWARRHFRLTPVIYVPGNHEYYGEDLSEHIEAMLQEGRKRGVDVLDGDALVLGGVRFLGATLWTDYAIDANSRPAAIEQESLYAREAMENFHVIRNNGNGSLLPREVLVIHLSRVAWLQAKLKEPFAGSTVVVNHHAPSPRSIARQFHGSQLNASFVSDLTRLMGRPRIRQSQSTRHRPVMPALWIHGHTHNSLNYIECETRIVCTARGYSPYEPNPDFDPALAVEVPL